MYVNLIACRIKESDVIHFGVWGEWSSTAIGKGAEGSGTKGSQIGNVWHVKIRAEKLITKIK
jgi:hypothetical protein